MFIVADLVSLNIKGPVYYILLYLYPTFSQASELLKIFKIHNNSGIYSRRLHQKCIRS